MTVRLPVKNAQSAYDLLEQLRIAGLVNTRDFTWFFSPQRCDFYGSVEEEAYVEFKFVDAKMATYFKLKWS